MEQINENRFPNSQKVARKWFRLIFLILGVALILISIFIAVTAFFFEKFFDVLERVYINCFINLAYLPIIFMGLIVIIYLLPAIPFDSKKIIRFSQTKDSIMIVNEQKIPTTKRYKIRRLFLNLLAILTILTFTTYTIFIVVFAFIL